MPAVKDTKSVMRDHFELRQHTPCLDASDFTLSPLFPPIKTADLNEQTLHPEPPRLSFGAAARARSIAMERPAVRQKVLFKNQD
eukprot:5189433-Amphidinium_carterae.1